jgi:hypothetical protein
MTDRKDALTKLLNKVEVGWYSDDIESTVRVMFPNDIGFRLTPEALRIVNAYNGSLDAAKELHEAALPDWRITHAFGLVSGEVAKFNLTHNDKPSTYVRAESTNPARAWLIAILKALIAGENVNVNDKGKMT